MQKILQTKPQENLWQSIYRKNVIWHVGLAEICRYAKIGDGMQISALQLSPEIRRLAQVRVSLGMLTPNVERFERPTLSARTLKVSVKYPYANGSFIIPH